MGIIDKLKLLFKTAKPVGEFIDQIKGARLKYKTIPFWVSILGSGTALVAAFQGIIPADIGAEVAGALAVFYNILRGLDKAGQEGVKPALHSTEFWVGALTILSTELLKVQAAGINNKVTSAISLFVATAMALAQNIGAQQPADVKNMIEGTTPAPKNP